MRPSLLLAPALLLLIGTPVTSEADSCAGRLVMSFELATTRAPESVNLGHGLLLRAVPTDGGWELQVVDLVNPDVQGNRLAPIANWHGAQPFLITPYMAGIYPTERVIAVRGTAERVCIRILEPRMEHGKASPGYADGTVEVRWSGASG